MREIKFRVWDAERTLFIYSDESDAQIVFGGGMVAVSFGSETFREQGGEIEEGIIMLDVENPVLMQFTGHQIAGKDVYEGDIVRLEENADGIDPDDKMTWYVVTWIQEWCMFALLRAKDEYREYLAGGVEELDTTMFWTFPLDLEDTDSSKHYLCGNIYENENLLK